MNLCFLLHAEYHRTYVFLPLQNHLDLHAVLWLESYLVKWPKTFIVVSHAREFLNTVRVYFSLT